MEKKKLIAKEILWFGFFCVTTLFVSREYPSHTLVGRAQQGMFVGMPFGVRFVIVLASLYLFRAIVWAIKTLWFGEKKQTKD